jgi:hypothetical protein
MGVVALEEATDQAVPCVNQIESGVEFRHLACICLPVFLTKKSKSLSVYHSQPFIVLKAGGD